MIFMTKKIAIIGARGINNYGGFETAVGEIAPALVKKGYEVYCSCEKTDCNPKTYQGANLIYFPIKMSSNYVLRKVMEILYDMYFNIYCTISLKCDVIYSLGLGANMFVLFPRLFGKKSMVNVDGLEWRRSKFSTFERRTLKIFFDLILICSNYVIVDNEALKSYISSKYWDKVCYIPYGVKEFEEITWDQNEIEWKITKNNYWLVVARLEPENNIHLILNAYIKSKSKKPLVIVGNFVSESYEDSIKEILKNKPEYKSIIFTGGIYNLKILNMLRQNCKAYIHGHSVGGTNPSLLEAMIMKNIIIAHNNEFNREVAGDSVLYFNNSSNLKDMIELIEKNETYYLKLKIEAYSKAKDNYSWDKIINLYQNMFLNHD